MRKGTSIPYISHLMAVASLVLEHGGSENAAIAALLHDAVEDQGGLATAELIRRAFGDEVEQIVLNCTGATPGPGEEKLAWRPRKEAYLAHLAQVDAETALVVTCDKLHNLSALVRDLEQDGVATLGRFSEPDQLVWYFEGIVAALQRFASEAPVAALQARLAQFRALAAGRQSTPEEARA